MTELDKKLWKLIEDEFKGALPYLDGSLRYTEGLLLDFARRAARIGAEQLAEDCVKLSESGGGR